MWPGRVGCLISINVIMLSCILVMLVSSFGPPNIARGTRLKSYSKDFKQHIQYSRPVSSYLMAWPEHMHQICNLNMTSATIAARLGQEVLLSTLFWALIQMSSEISVLSSFSQLFLILSNLTLSTEKITKYKWAVKPFNQKGKSKSQMTFQGDLETMDNFT